MRRKSYKPGDPHYVASWPSPYSFRTNHTFMDMIDMAFFHAHREEWSRAYWYLEALRVGRRSEGWPPWSPL